MITRSLLLPLPNNVVFLLKKKAMRNVFAWKVQNFMSTSKDSFTKIQNRKSKLWVSKIEKTKSRSEVLRK